MNEGLVIIMSINLPLPRVFILANSTDPDGTPRNAASHLGLRCLFLPLFACIQSVPHVRTLNLKLATPLSSIHGNYFSVFVIFVLVFLSDTSRKVTSYI